MQLIVTSQAAKNKVLAITDPCQQIPAYFNTHIGASTPHYTSGLCDYASV